MKKEYYFNINFQGEIYGVMAISIDNIYFCRLTKVYTCLKYKPFIKTALEKGIEYNPSLRENLFDGWTIIIRINRK
ncbi:unnamed protein product [marine sediment metagenome]|uniref:Uncharacterized protein n=1 Tax=marine sediment metagenome TaxID=412755 RepID=X1BEA5_9ZZZZ